MGGGTSLATGLEGSLTPFNQCRQQEAFHHSAGNTLHTLPGKSGSAETTLSLLKSPETSAQCSLEQPSLAAKMAQNGLSRTGSQKRAREDDFSTPLQDSQEAKILQRHGIDVLASSRPTASSEGIAKRQKSWSNGTFEPTVSHALGTSTHKSREGADAKPLPDEQFGSDNALRFDASNKRRRTHIGRPQSDKPSDSALSHGRLEESQCLATETLSTEELVKRLKHELLPENGSSGGRILLGQVLKSSLLIDQPILYKASSSKAQDITGHIVAGGMIACDCKECDGKIVNLLKFEEHSGSADRYCTSNMILSNYNLSLKDVWARANAETNLAPKSLENGQLRRPEVIRQCSVCQQEGSMLVKCGGGCKRYTHPACIQKDPSFTGPWYCKDCLAARIDQEMQKVETPRPSSGRGRKGNKSSEGKRLSGRNSDTPKNGMRSSTPRSSYGGRGQGKPPSSSGQRTASKPQRLHMAAPTAKVGLSQGRLVRNSNKHKRLFNPDEPNGVKTGQKVVYQTSQGEKLLHGEIRVSSDGPCGILCECCDKVISCSQFEAHAGRGSRRAPYDNIFLNGITLRKLAAALPSDQPVPSTQLQQSEVVQDDMLGGCVLCDEKNFQRHGFADLTVILCDQCEREFHVGCLREHMNISLDAVPEGDWFCSEPCQSVHKSLRDRVQEGPMQIDEDYQWQLLHGKDGSHGTTWTLKGAYDILDEGFDPILDQITEQDLIKAMVYSEKQGEWDYTGMFAAILKYKKQAVCALVMRAFGNMLAEVPIIATRCQARRKGHARYLMAALENLLREVGVRTIALPSSDSTVETWTKGFSFQHMAADQLQTARESLRLMVFPGTEVLYKVLLPDQPPFLVAKADKTKNAKAAEGNSAESMIGLGAGQHSNAGPNLLSVKVSVDESSRVHLQVTDLTVDGPAQPKQESFESPSPEQPRIGGLDAPPHCDQGIEMLNKQD